MRKTLSYAPPHRPLPAKYSFDEIPEVRACSTPDQCEIIDPIEFARHGDTPAVIGDGFFQRAKDLLGMSRA